MTKKKSNVLLNIGPSREAIVAARAAVMEIVKAPCGDKVKCKALVALENICEVDNITVSDCVFNG